MNSSDKWFIWLIALLICATIQWLGHYIRGGAENVNLWSDILPSIIISSCILINIYKTN